MDIEPTSFSRPPLSEERTRQISRSIRSFVPSAGTAPSQIKEFENLLDHLLQTSTYATLGTTHRVSAWNTLCSLVDQGLESDLPEVREVIWTSKTWGRALELYLCHAQNARPKSARQLLVTLTNALDKAPTDVKANLKHSATKRLVRCLLDLQDPFRAKASAQLLSSLLNKNVVEIEVVLLSFRESQQTNPAAVDITTSADVSFEVERADVLEMLFSWLGKGDFGSTIAQSIAAVLDKIPPRDSWNQPIWETPLEKAYLQNSANVDDLRAHIFPMLFKRSFADFAAFLQSQGLDQLLITQKVAEFTGGQSYELLFAALQTGKELGILLETEESEVSYASPAVYVPVQLIGRLLLQRSRPARLTGLSLLITSHSITRPLSLAALNLARRSLGVLFADVDADFRSEVFNAFSRLIDRIRAVTAVLARQATLQKTQSLASPASNAVFDFHQAFVKRMIKFFAWELRPTASYQRHISALKCISILARSGLDEDVPVDFYSKSAQGETKWAFRARILDQDLQRLLLDNLMDPFDDVRATASTILGYYCSSATKGVLQQAQLASALERAESMMLATGRADHADGVAHMYSICYRRCGNGVTDLADFWSSRQAFLLHLLEKLERMLASAKQNLGDAVQRYPMHGLLTSLRYVLQHDQASSGIETHSRLFDNLRQVWDVVKPILCNDAPEGYVPEELEDSPESTKESLSYCWRALKEASLLLSSLISSQPVTGDTDIIQQMSRLCFTQLAELRHRGAFSTVAQTWQGCCMRCKDLRDLSGSLMLEVWYTDVLEILRNNVTINTRRSAGLPSLLCGILVADKSGALLTRAFADLEAIARKDVDAASAEEGSLAQVHAMNCLKDILKNTRLGEQTQYQVPTALQLAADALRSDVWAVRNCGLMLFRAVIDRLLGTNESQFEDDVVLQKRIFAEQHPALLDVVLGLLPQPGASAQDSSVRYEGVFPALQLLQLTRIPSERLEEAKAAVGALTASSSWHVRDKAARTLASLIHGDQIPLQLSVLLDTDVCSQNTLHGALLAAKFIMRQATRALSHSKPPTETQIIKSSSTEYIKIIESVADIYKETPSVVTKAACVDLLREICAFSSQSADNDQVNTQDHLFCNFVDPSLQEQGVASVFAHLLSQSLYDTSSAVLRQAWARYAAHHIATYKLGTTKEADIFLHALFELAHRDDDAASYFVAPLNWVEMRNGGKGALVIELCTKLLAGEDSSIGLKCEALQTLLVLLTKDSSTVTAEMWHVLAIATGKQLSVNHNQRYVDLSLQLRAVAFEGATTRPHGSIEADSLIRWANECIVAVNGTGLHTREAAADALERLDITWSLMAEEKEQDMAKAFRGLCCAVYDLLNDDDEDVRLLAAGITKRILAQATEWKDVDLEPIVAGQKLLTLYTARASGSAQSLPLERTYALGRAYGLSAKAAAVSVADQLAKLSQSDTALFAEEKQNLYVDDSQEVRVWSQVTSKLLAVQTVPFSPDEFITWVSDGLETLAKRAEDSPDGALGWSTSEDVFALGLRVILGAEVVLQMKSRGVPVPALETKLFACAKAFESGEVNCLWRWEVERILSDAVMGSLGKLNTNTVKRYQVGA